MPPGCGSDRARSAREASANSESDPFHAKQHFCSSERNWYLIGTTGRTAGRNEKNPLITSGFFHAAERSRTSTAR
jgi:hypothetical protein